MKNATIRFTGTLLALAISISGTNCSSDITSTGDSDTSSGTVTDIPTPTGCCFTQDSDYEPFFPAGNELIIPASDKIATNYFCGATDDPMKSNALKNYWIDTLQYTKKIGQKDISLRIEDHAANPADLVAKVERKKTEAVEAAKTNTAVTVKELKTAEYTGYSWVDATQGNNSSNILIEVVVDGRFYVQIMGVDHTRIELGMQLLEQIPMKDLAAKCK